MMCLYGKTFPVHFALSQQQQRTPYMSKLFGELIEKARHHNIFAVVYHQVGRYLHKHSFCVIIESIINRTQFFCHHPLVQQEKHIILLDLLPFILLFHRIGGNKRRIGLFLLNHTRGFDHAPLFTPNVGRFRQGMIVEVPLQLWNMPGTPSVDSLRDVLAAYYAAYRFVSVADAAATADRAALLDPEELNDTNELRLYVFGNDDAGQAVLAAQLDNLGKGASGAAVQNLNIMLGLDEAAGLA